MTVNKVYRCRLCAGSFTFGERRPHLLFQHELRVEGLALADHFIYTPAAQPSER